MIRKESEKFLLIAMSFFRARHVPKKRFASGRRADQLVSSTRDNCRMVKVYIAKAREAMREESQ